MGSTPLQLNTLAVKQMINERRLYMQSPETLWLLVPSREYAGKGITEPAIPLLLLV